MVAEPLKIRTIHLTASVITGISIFVLVYMLLSIIFFREFFIINSLSIIIILIAIVASVYLSSRAVRSETIFLVQNGELIISSQTDFYNISGSRSMLLSDIKAYDLSTQRLILYRYNQRPVFIRLKDISTTDKEELISLLGNNKIISIQALKTLSRLSFKQAFYKGLIVLLSGLGIFCMIYATEIFFLYPSYDRNLLIGSNCVVIVLILYFIYKKLQKNYRIEASGSFILLGIIMAFINISVPDQIDIFLQKPVPINNLSNIKSHPAQKFFLFRRILYDTTSIGYYQSVNHSRRLMRSSVSHYFTSPVYHSENPGIPDNHFWVGSLYVQREKTYSASQTPRLRLAFIKEKLREFKASTNYPNGFYQVVYSDLNPGFRAGNYYKAAQATHRIGSPLIILRPFKETFEEYRASKVKEISIVIAVLTAFFLANVFVIATYR